MPFVETLLKAYRSEAKFATARAAMEVGGWRVKKWQSRTEHWNAFSVSEGACSTVPEQALYLGNPEVMRPGYGAVRGGMGLARLMVLPLWPFAWLWAKWRSGPRIDVLYERG
jgi:hypothetical protein